MAQPPPARIGPYDVLRSLAQGGMAEVFEVEDPASGEHLALKLLFLSQGTTLQRFNREYEAMIRLNHPNIVRVYHYGLHEGMPWLTMELLDGIQCQMWARNTGKPGSKKRTREVVRIAHDIARALDHIHRRGLVHRDLKSANALVLPDGRVKLLDFGTAHLVDGAEAITREREFLGTFAYAAPEQLTGKGIDHRADLYAFGVLLYRLLTGLLPFESEDPHRLAEEKLRGCQRSPRSVCRWLPEALDRLVMALLEPDPARRPQTGGLVADQLELVAGEPLVIPGTLDVNASAERLVGREPQLRTASAWLDACSPGSIAVVVGPPASARSRVVAAIEQLVRARGWRQLAVPLAEGGAYEDVVRLLSAVAGTFGEDAPAPVRTASLALARANTGDAAAQASPQRREALRSLGALLLGARTRADGLPMLLQLHDLHHADEPTLELLAGLLNLCARAGTPVLVLGDWDDLASDRGRLVRAIPSVKRIPLPPLTVEQVALYVGSILHRRPPPASVARRIQAASGGQPLYVENVVVDLVDHGLLKVIGRDPNRLEWGEQEDLDVPIPEAARHSLEDLLAPVPAEARRVLEALALLGGDADEGLLGRALDRSPSEVRPSVVDLVAHGIAETGQGRVKLRQSLAGMLVEQAMHPCRRDVLQRRLAQALGDDVVTPERLQLLVRGGRLAEAVDRALPSAEALLATARPVSALELLEVVIPEADLRLPAVTLARLHLVHATCLVLARPTDAGIARSLARAAEIGGNTVFMAELAFTRARVQRAIGHYGNYRAQLLDAWKLLSTDRDASATGEVVGLGDPDLTDPFIARKRKRTVIAPAVASTVAENLGTALHMAGLLEESGEWLRRARTLASNAKITPVQADVALARWFAGRGHLKEAEKALSRIVQHCHKREDVRGLAIALPAWTEALRQQGRFSEALGWLNRTTPGLRHGEAPSAYVRMLVATAWAEVELCRLGRAQECVDELAATLRRGEHLHLRLEADLVRGKILLQSDELREALQVLDSVEERARAAELVLIAEHARALRGETLWARGKYTKARQELDIACRRLETTGDVATLTAACLARVRAMAGTVDPAALMRPVKEYAETQPAALVRLEWHLATARWLRAINRDPAPAWRKAQQVLDKIAKRLDETDRAALRVHPWTREIRHVEPV